MSRRAKASAPEAAWLLQSPEGQAILKHLGGSQNDGFNASLLTAMARTLWVPPGQTPDDRNAQLSPALVAMGGFKPSDEIEGMIAAQAIAMHNASMECSRRAMIPEQPFEAAQGYRKAAASASRAFIELLSALDRRRGKGSQQKVTVEHVHVHPGGQAIVGNVQAGGPTPQGGPGGNSGSQEKPCGAPAPLDHNAAAGPIGPALRRQDETREPLPVARDVRQSAMPAARRG